MSLAALIRGMASAGAPAEAIALAVEAIEARETAEAERKAKAAGRKRNERERTRLSQDADVTVTRHEQDSPATIPTGSPQEDKEDQPPSQSPPIAPLSHEEALAIWNAMAGPLGLPLAQTATGKRQAMLRQRLAEHGADGFRKAVAAVGRSKFCQGQNERAWRADLGFLLRPDNFVKLIEGGYDPAGLVNGEAQRPRRTIDDIKRGIARAEDLNDPDRAAELKAELAAMTNLSADANVAHLVQAASKNLRAVAR